MTALAGFVEWGGRRAKKQDCERMLRAQQSFASQPPIVFSLHSAVFGAALFPTLPEDQFDRQPLCSDNLLLVADIRIDNRRQLIVELGLAIRSYAILSDVDILFAAWKQVGLNCLSRLRGDYAIATYDESTGKVTLARSVTGQRPLFYRKTAQSVGFSSMPSGLLSMPGATSFVDADSLIRATLDLPYRGNSTCLADVCRVQPGSCVTISPVGASVELTWQPEFSATPIRPNRDGVEEYRHHLDEAVESRLRRTSKYIAAHLSSGYDSSAVASTAARLETKPVIALTAAPRVDFIAPSIRGRIADEGALAQLAARMAAMDHYIVRDTSNLIQRIRAQIRFYQEPRRNLVNSGWLFLLDEAARACDAQIVLAAELGNLTINTGGLFALEDYRKLRGTLRWCKEAVAAVRRSDVSWRGVLFNSFRSCLPSQVQSQLYRRFMDIQPSQNLGFVRREMFDRHPQIIADSLLPFSGGGGCRDRWDKIQSLDYGTTRKGSLAESRIETRDPTADQELIDFSMRLAPEAMLSGGMFRPLARIALKDRLPMEIIDAPLRGIQSADWFERISRNAFRDLTDEIRTNTTAFNLLDFDRIYTAIDRWPVSNVSSFHAYQEYAVYLPLALSVGLYIKEVEEGALSTSSYT